ncbi:hypothetical protein MMC13_004521 [Lambiella insularis]|nr:hypothetical protein [Lambiella insularis]
MASHTLAIAKASLAAGLMRPDPIPVSRDHIAHFHELLDTALAKCSPGNIQRCKEWLLQNAVSSATRFTAVTKYLVALATSLSGNSEQQQNGSTNVQRSLGRRKQLHILYILNDLLHHTKYHQQQPSSHSTVLQTLQPHLVNLVEVTSAYEATKYPRQRRRISELLAEWERQYDYSAFYFQTLRDAVTNSALSDSKKNPAALLIEDKAVDLQNRKKTDTPFLMPSMHGDPSAPYYELPAGNMMHHIIPNSATPINPHIMKPLQFTAGPPDESLVIAVKDFLKDVDVLYGHNPGEDEGISMEIDEIGQTFIRDELGEKVIGEAYYGWSKAFCEKMKMRRSGKIAPRSRGRSDSEEQRSLSPRKRRRYSSSGGSRRSSRSDSRSYQRRQDSFSPPTRMRSRTRSPPRFGRRQSSRSPSRSYSPPSTAYPPASAPRLEARSQYPSQSSVPQAPFPVPFPQGVALGPNGMPIPPPPPPNYTGVWPPPPPSISPNGPFAAPPFVPQLPPVSAYAQNPEENLAHGKGSGPGWAGQEQWEQYPRRGYGQPPSQGQRGGQYAGRSRGGRGGRRG